MKSMRLARLRETRARGEQSRGTKTRGMERRGENRSGVVSGEPRNLILAIRLSTRRQPFHEQCFTLSPRIPVCVRFSEEELLQEADSHQQVPFAMHRRIEAVLIVAFALVLAVRSDGNLKCYMCTSLTKQGCESDPAAHNLEPVDCSLNKMVEWQQTVQKENILRQLSSIFEVDNLQHHQASAPMACAKMILKVDDKDVTVRSCQTAKTDTLDPCKAIEGKLASNAINMEHCDLCSHDACNDSTAPSSRTLVVLMSVLGAVAFGAFYHNA